MANKTNITINGIEYYKLQKTVGKKQNKAGLWVRDVKTFYGKNKSDAEAKYREYKKAQTLGIDPVKSTFGEALDEWVEHKFKKDGKYKDSTKTRYLSAYGFLKNNPVMGVPLSKLREMNLQSVYNGLPCSPATVKALHKLLRLFFKYAAHQHYCNDLTATLVLPQIPQTAAEDVVIWTEADLNTVLTDSQDHRLHFLFVMLTYTGMRISEALALKYDDIGDVIKINKQVGQTNGKRDIIETKTGASVRSVPASDEIRAALVNHKAQHQAEQLQYGYRTEYVFTTKTGRFYDIASIRKSTNRLYKALSVPLNGFHVYRHTFGTKLAEAGVPIQTVAKLMGHSSISVTAKYYINVNEKQKENAIKQLSKLI